MSAFTSQMHIPCLDNLHTRILQSLTALLGKSNLVNLLSGSVSRKQRKPGQTVAPAEETPLETDN